MKKEGYLVLKAVFYVSTLSLLILVALGVLDSCKKIGGNINDREELSEYSILLEDRLKCESGRICSDIYVFPCEGEGFERADGIKFRYMDIDESRKPLWKSIVHDRSKKTLYKINENGLKLQLSPFVEEMQVKKEKIRDGKTRIHFRIIYRKNRVSYESAFYINTEEYR